MNRLESATLRAATPSDAKAICALLRRAFRGFKPLYTPQAFAATVLPEAGILERMAEGPVCVAELGGTIIGTISASVIDGSVLIRGMAVDSEAQGQSVGRLLLELVEGFSRERGHSRLSLYTTAFLLRAIRLYRSCGYEFTGETIHPHGTELLRMMKTLAPAADDCLRR